MQKLNLYVMQTLFYSRNALCMNKLFAIAPNILGQRQDFGSLLRSRLCCHL